MTGLRQADGVVEPVDIDGIPCYAPDVARSEADYPGVGFDVTAGVESRSFWCRSRIRIVRRMIERFADRTRTLDLLDLGCGIGGMVGALQALDRLNLTGSEIYLSGLRYARSRFPGIRFIQLDATAIPFTDRFDIIGAFDVIEHIEEDDRVIASVHAALRPGGLFLVTVPQHPWLWSRLDELVHHKRRYTRRQLVEQLAAAGFEVEFTTSFVTLLFPLMAMVRLLRRPRPRYDDRRGELESEVAFPGVVNRAFDLAMRVDEACIAAGWSLPVGGSLLAVARKPVRG